jgi:hypothetical protein
MASDGNFAMNLKTLDVVASLLDSTIVLLNMSMLVMLCCSVKVFRLTTRLVFKPHPKELHMNELLEPDHRPECPVLHLHSLNIF